MNTIKIIKKEEISKIISFKDFENFVRSEEDTLNNIIANSLGFSKNKLKQISKEQMTLFHFAVAKDYLVQSLVYIEDEDRNFVYDYIEKTSFLSVNFEFFKLISQTDDSVRVERIQSGKITEFRKEEGVTFPEGQVFYAMTFYQEGEFYMAKTFVSLDDEEADSIYDILINYDDTNASHIFVDRILVGRMLKGYLASIDDLMNEYGGELLDNFDEAEVLNFYNHLNGLAKYLIISPEDLDLYQLNYYDYIKGQCQVGNFVVDGDLESFIEICKYLMESVSQDLGHEVLGKKYILQAEENILSLRKEILKNHPLTDQETIDFVGKEVMKNSDDLNEFVKLSYFIDCLARDANLDLTVTNKIKLKSIRSFLEEFIPDYKSSEDKDFEKTKILVDLSFAILLANNLVFIDEGQVFPTDRLNFFLDSDPVIRLANIIKGIFRKETFTYYLAKAEKTGEETFTKTMEALRTNNFFDFGLDKKEVDILKLLQALDIIRERDHQGEIFYDCNELGKFLQGQEEKKQKKAKVINLADFRQK